MTPTMNNASALIRARLEVHDNPWISRDNFHHTETKLRFKVSRTNPRDTESESDCSIKDQENLTPFYDASRINPWRPQIPQDTLKNKDKDTKKRRDKWTAVEMDALKNNSSLVMKPKSMTEQRRAALAAIFPNRTLRAVQAKLFKIKAAEGKETRNSAEAQVTSSFPGNSEGASGEIEDNEVI